jgi:hypothetical protein
MRNTNTPRFQQQHYEQVAGVLNQARLNLLVTVQADVQHSWLHTVNMFVTMFQFDNPKFKPDVFRRACGAL